MSQGHTTLRWLLHQSGRVHRLPRLLARAHDVRLGLNAKEFKPERWIDQETGKLIAVSAFKFNAFYTGPRICLGMNLAMMKMKTVAAVLLSKFRFSLVPNQEINYAFSMTMPMKNEMKMHVTPSTPAAH